MPFVPKQSCCGQPAHNNGNPKEAISVAKATITSFETASDVIVPSASCAGMIKHHYPVLFANQSEDWQQKAQQLAAKTHEFTEYYANLTENIPLEAEYNGRIGYHESCSARREMKITSATKLLRKVKGSEVVDLPGNEECCGFGGLFSVKFDEISNAMVATKTRKIQAATVDMVTGVDLGCLMNIAGKLRKEGVTTPVYHIAEILAGDLAAPSI